MDVAKVFEFPVAEFWRQPRSLLGPGAYEQAGPEAAEMGLRNVLIVTTGLSGTGIVDEVTQNFEAAGVSTVLYDKVESNPKDYNVMDAYSAFVEGSATASSRSAAGARTTRPRARGSWPPTTDATRTSSRA